jgi:energy-coupling factor transporter ATP-binding protein EcfA2
VKALEFGLNQNISSDQFQNLTYA